MKIKASAVGTAGAFLFTQVCGLCSRKRFWLTIQHSLRPDWNNREKTFARGDYIHFDLSEIPPVGCVKAD